MKDMTSLLPQPSLQGQDEVWRLLPELCAIVVTRRKTNSSKAGTILGGYIKDRVDGYVICSRLCRYVGIIYRQIMNGCFISLYMIIPYAVSFIIYFTILGGYEKLFSKMR